MKWNWSTFLIIGMSLFIIMIVGMGIRMARSTTELYERDYYDKGEHHALRMEQEKRGLAVKIHYNPNSKSLVVTQNATQFHIENITLRKMSNADQDLRLIPQRMDTIAVQLSKGQWVAEVNGTVDNQRFFKKFTINI